MKVALLAYTSIFIPAGNAAEANKPGVATIRVGTSYQAPENVLYQPGFPALVTTIPDPADQAAMVADVQKAKQSADIVSRWNALPPDKWNGSLEFFGHPRSASGMAWSFLFDIVHHRGQISTYLRPMGSTVPQIYGPSGDEP